MLFYRGHRGANTLAISRRVIGAAGGSRETLGRPALGGPPYSQWASRLTRSGRAIDHDFALHVRHLVGVVHVDFQRLLDRVLGKVPQRLQERAGDFP